METEKQSAKENEHGIRSIESEQQLANHVKEADQGKSSKQTNRQPARKLIGLQVGFGIC